MFKNRNVTFGITSQKFLRALRDAIKDYSKSYDILEDVYVGFKRYTNEVDQLNKQVIIKSISSEDSDNMFIRWQTFGVSVYAKGLEEVDELSALVESIMNSLVSQKEGIRNCDIIVSASETENVYSQLSRNQSGIEDWRLITVEVSFVPTQFNKN